MGTIIILVVAFFVWRHFSTKKKAQKQEKAVEQAMHSGNLHRPVAARKLRGKPVAQSELPRHTVDLKTGSEDGYIGKGDYNPDFSFACTKKIYDDCLADYQKSGLTIRNEKNGEAFSFVKYGITLAENYRDGYGCDVDPEAAIQIMKNMLEFWDSQKGNPNLRTEVGVEITQRFSDGLLCMADSYAQQGNESEANRYYRMAFASASVYGNPAHVKGRVIEHAMGDFGPDYTRPVCLAAAIELALALAGEGDTMGGHYLTSLLELRKANVSNLGRTWSQDYSIYSQLDGAYAQYRLGMAKLYGLGTKQDVEAGLKQLEQAYQNGSVQAANLLSNYYMLLRYAGTFDKASSAAIDRLDHTWSNNYDRLKQDSSALKNIMSTGIANEDAESLAGKYAPKYKPAAASTEADETPKPSKDFNGSREEPREQNPLEAMPFIIYDDSNREWTRRGIFGDHAEYYNEDGDSIIIYHADVYGKSANTSAGTFHWY